MMSEQIYTYEQAEEYLTRRQQQDSAQGQVRAAFGIHDRSLTKQEQKYIDTWFMEYHFDISMVKLAYERTIDPDWKGFVPLYQQDSDKLAREGNHQSKGCSQRTSER